MINSRGFAAATAMSLILVLAAWTDALAQSKINEHPNVLPRPPLKNIQPRPVAAPAAVAQHPATTSAAPAAAPAPTAAANQTGDHDGNRGAFAAGVAAGVVIGGAAAAPGIYYVPVPSPADDAVAYCTQTYSSYDPQSGTYVGDDGNLHPCP